MLQSRIQAHAPVRLPAFRGTRVMMLPVIVGQPDSLHLGEYREVFAAMSRALPGCEGRTAYFTVDEKVLHEGQTHRRAGVHTDGGQGRGWGGPLNPWANIDTGMVSLSSHVGCRAWRGDVPGRTREEGDASRLDLSGTEEVELQPDVPYWMSAECVHESLPARRVTPRQFVRLSPPSDAPWYEGYTASPLGVRPTGCVLPRRPFMDV